MSVDPGVFMVVVAAVVDKDTATVDWFHATRIDKRTTMHDRDSTDTTRDPPFCRCCCCCCGGLDDGSIFEEAGGPMDGTNQSIS